MNTSLIHLLRAKTRDIANYLRTTQRATGGELEMVLNRLLIALILFLFVHIQLDYSAEADRPIFALLYFFCACSGFLALATFLDPYEHHIRRIAALVLDLGVLTVTLWYGGEKMQVLFPIYLWVTIGNGFRFGQRYLLAACLFSFSGFLVVLFKAQWLEDHLWLSVGLLLCLVIVPLYAMRLIRSLAKAKAQAEEANRAKTMFLASVSHELKTPLNAIVGMGDLLNASHLGKEQQEMVQTIAGSASTLSGLIERILTYSKAETHSLDIQQTTYCIREVLHCVEQIIEPQARAKGLHFNTCVIGDVPDVAVGDPRHITEIVLNLAGNALKFTPTGFLLISVTTRRSQRTGKMVLKWCVHDSGIGISAKVQEKIFDQFSQADATIVDRFGGTGLGLAIAKHTARAMKGTITVHSRPKEGSVFCLHVPLQPAPSVLCNNKLTHETIWVLMPDHSLSYAMAQLTQSGFHVRSIDSPREFAALCAELQRAPRAGTLVGQLPSLVAASISDEQALLFSGGVIGISASRSIDFSFGSSLRLPSLCRAIGRSENLLALLLSPTRPSQEAQHQAQESLAELSAPLHVLVADDNATNRLVLERMLILLGHSCTLVENGEAALDAIDTEQFDLVIMDINMPIMNGLDAIKTIRLLERGSQQRLPIIALSANTTAAGQEDAKLAGANLCEAKPLTIKRLAAALSFVVLPTGSQGELDHYSDGRNEATAQVDTSVLAQLIDLGGIAFLQELYEEFRRDGASLLQQMEAALAARDFTALRQYAHALRSSSAYLGLLHCAQICNEIENMSAPALRRDGSKKMRALAAQHMQSCTALAEACQNKRPPL